MPEEVTVTYLFDSYHAREADWLARRVHDPNDVEDIMATAYMRAVGYLRAGQTVNHPASWFRSIINNCWVDMIRYRHRRKRPDAHMVDLDSFPEIEDLFDSLIDSDQTDRILDGLIVSDQLSELFVRAGLGYSDYAILVQFAAGYAPADIATANGLPLDATIARREASLCLLRALASTDAQGEVG